MIKKIFVIGTVFASIIILSACETAPIDQQNQQPATDNTQNQGTESQVEVNNQLLSGSEGLLDMAVNLDEESMEEVSEADSSNYLAAVTAKDAQICDQIENSEYIQLCKDAVNNEILMNRALEELDPQLCEQLKAVEDEVEACKAKVEAAGNVADAKEKELAALRTQMSLSDEIVEEEDVTRCAELGEEYVKSCELDILLNKAFEENDITLCQQASSADTVTLCETKFRELLPEDEQTPEAD